MTTRWGGEGRSTRRSPAYQRQPGRRPADERRRRSWPAEQEDPEAERTGISRSAAIRRGVSQAERPKLAARHKLGLAGAFFGSFLIAVGILTAFAEELQGWAYLGAFVISLVSSATVVLPAPGAPAIILMAKDLNPVLLGVVSGVGTGLGGVTAYMVGAASRSAVSQSRLAALMTRLFNSRWGPAILFLANLIPFMPGDAVSAIAGAIRYSLLRYLVYMTTASVLKMIGLSLLGAYATERLLRHLEIFSS